MSENLRVEISGDVKELEKATAKASKSLKDFEKVAEKSVGGIEQPSKNAAKSLGGLNKESGRVNNTLLEFNRVVQDAPFGIQGVANNLTQLTQNFGYLRQSTGSTGSALKALIAGFAGPAGILFAVSAVTSLLVTYGDKLFKTKDKQLELAEATEKASEKLQAYADALEQVDRSRLKGEQSAQKELLTLKQLRTVVEDTSRSTIDRRKAVQELRRLFPSYFKDLKDEKILSGGLSTVYDQLTTSILKRAKATAATNQIVKNSEKQLIIESQLAAINSKIATEKNKINARIAQGAKTLDTSAGLEGAGIKRTAQKATEQNKLNKLLEEQNKLIGQQQNLELSNIDLSQLIDSNGGIDLSGVDLKGGSNLPKLKVSPVIEFDVSSEGIDTSGVQNIADALVAPLLNAPIAEAMSALEFELRAAAIRLNENLNALLQSSISNTISQIGSGIGEAIAQGGNVLEAAGRGLLSGLGGFLSQMGSLLIEYGTLAVLKGKLDLAIIAGGPVAIGAGLAAIAVGIALSAAGSAIGSFAQGGTGGSANTSTGGSGSTRTFSSSGGFDGGEVVFQISGQNLVGVLNRTLDRNSALGG